MTDLKDVRLYVGGPSNRPPMHEHVGSLIKLIGACWEMNLPIEHRWATGDSLVQRARNRLVHWFLKTDATHLLMVDDDIVFDPAWVFEMLKTGHPFVGGTYPLKRMRPEMVERAYKAGVGPRDIFKHSTRLCLNMPSKSDGTAVVRSGCLEVKDLGTGFILLQRRVLEEMILAYPETMYRTCKNDEFEPMHALFDCAIDPDDLQYLSEDYLFARRWQKMGGTVQWYIKAICKHIGQFTYEGDLRTFFTPVVAKEEPASDAPAETEAA